MWREVMDWIDNKCYTIETILDRLQGRRSI